MCAYLLLDGWGDRTIKDEIAKGVDIWFIKQLKEIVNIKDGTIPECRNISDILTEDNIGMINFYWFYKKNGNPFNVGWYYWPCVAFDLINALDGVNWNG